MDEIPAIERVLVTGATGFVGRNVVRALLGRGITPVCLVRSPEKLYGQHREAAPSRFIVVAGSLRDRTALRSAADQSQAAIHLAGIIIARRLQSQTFHRVHVQGTRNVVEAVRDAGVKRYLHMSALGTRPDALSTYHQTKWEAEECVRGSALDWTIFRPSLIHGPDGEFMRLMKRFMCAIVPPVIPYFGSGEAKVQPVSVRDVAHCSVKALDVTDSIRKVYPLGGPRAYSWLGMYNACRALMPEARHWKPLVSLPVPMARVAAVLSAPAMAVAELAVPSLGLMRFDGGQVQMAQEDSVCDHTLAEAAFGLTMRDFEEELAHYADQIR